MRVLVVVRDSAKRAWADAGAVAALARASAPLAGVWGAPPAVSAVRLEALRPAEQCRAVATSHVVLAAHGSALGNLVCASPGAVVVEAFPPGFHLDMFGALAAAADVYSLHVVAAGQEAVPQTRGHPGLPWGPAESEARDVAAFQPDPAALEAALAVAAQLLRREAARAWPRLRALRRACPAHKSGG